MHISKSNPIHQFPSVSGIEEGEKRQKKGSIGQRIVTIAPMRYALKKNAHIEVFTYTHLPKDASI